MKSKLNYKVFRNRYTQEDTEDTVHSTITSVAISQGQYNLQVTQCKAGNWVVLGGLGSAIHKTATIVSRNTEDAAIFKPLEFMTKAVMKISIEPRKPSELPIMIEALGKALL